MIITLFDGHNLCVFHAKQHIDIMGETYLINHTTFIKIVAVDECKECTKEAMRDYYDKVAKRREAAKEYEPE